MSSANDTPDSPHCPRSDRATGGVTRDRTTPGKTLSTGDGPLTRPGRTRRKFPCKDVSLLLRGSGLATTAQGAEKDPQLSTVQSQEKRFVTIDYILYICKSRKDFKEDLALVEQGPRQTVHHIGSVSSIVPSTLMTPH